MILVCDSVSCWRCGYREWLDELRDELGVELGGTTDDDRFTLLPMCWLGACNDAPVMIIDEDTYREVSPEEVGGILDDYD